EVSRAECSSRKPAEALGGVAFDRKLHDFLRSSAETAFPPARASALLHAVRYLRRRSHLSTGVVAVFFLQCRLRAAVTAGIQSRYGNCHRFRLTARPEQTCQDRFGAGPDGVNWRKLRVRLEGAGSLFSRSMGKFANPHRLGNTTCLGVA